VLDGFFRDMAGRFPDNYIHVGGDEVVTECWLDDPTITSWMTKMGIQNGTEIEQYFNKQISQIVNTLNKFPVYWHDPFVDGVVLQKGSTVEVWRNGTTLQKVIDQDYQALVAYPYYLDKQLPNPNSKHYLWGDTWMDFYEADPYDYVNGNNLRNIIGGEAAMWGEQVDATNIDSRVWPRACAVAERLWSNQFVNNVTLATPRLIDFRCRLAQRGIGAGPIAPDYCPLPDLSRFLQIS